MQVMPSSSPLQAAVSPVYRLAVVADDSAFAARLAEVMRGQGIDRMIEVESVDELRRHSAAETVEAVVLGLLSERTRLLQAYSDARLAFPTAAVVAVWPDDERREDKRVLRTGIDALVPAIEIESALVPALEAVRAGLVCVSRRKAEATTSESLSNREKQVLGMLIMGFSNAEIGQRLYLAESTVKSHLSSAYMKLGVRSRKDAAALILDPEDGLGTAILAISGG